MRHRPSANHDDRPPDIPIDMLVLHYTGMASAGEALERLCDGEAKVSAHYLIDEDGAVTRLVAEEHRAWHAGVAYWRGHMDINARSIGIELVNTGHEFGLASFPDEQMRALESLALGIVGRHPIPARNVVGHSDVAPRRKQDPGELFDWRRLSGLGLGLWPEGAVPHDMAEEQAVPLLDAIGYETGRLADTLSAFQRRYRPARIDGVLDRETAGLLRRLADLTG